MRSPSHQVVVVGAGVGGLSAAIDLARAGCAVTVLEAGPTVGGKMREVTVAGRALDAGPTVLTMRWVFEELFADAGADFSSEVPTDAVEVLARHAWPDGSRLDLFADPARSADAVAALAGRAEAARFLEFAAYARRIFEAVEGPFIRSARPSLGALAAEHGLRLFAALRDIDGWRTMWKALGDHFHDPRLRQLFARYATYCGSSPFAAPATLNLVAHVEQSGVWRVRGGMYRLAEGLRRLAERLGVDVRCGAPVNEIVRRGRRVEAVRLASGEELSADAVVCNAGVGALVEGRLGPGVVRAVPAPAGRSLSAVTWSMVARPEGFPLAHHNVFFSDDYRAEFEALFDRGRLPDRPTVYICAQDRGAAAPPREPERLLCLVNAPPLGPGDAPSPQEVERCEARTFRWLETVCGLRLEASVPPSRTVPADFARLFPGTGGALYGAPNHGWRASFRRHGTRTGLRNLYLCGGEVHPGAGVPMAASSGRLAAACVVEDLASTSTSRRAATPGGTSTSSTRSSASA